MPITRDACMTVTHTAHSPPPPGSLRVLVRPVAMLAGFAALAALAGRAPWVRHMLMVGPGLHAGPQGAMVFVLAASVFCAFGLPRQAVCFAAGAAYGIGAGCGLATLATVAGCLCGYGWGRWVGGVGVRLPARLGGVMARLGDFVRREPFAAVLTWRLMPVGSALVLNLACGMLGVRVVPFALATLLGSLPQTVVFVLVGSGMRLDGPWRTITAAVLFGLSALVGLWLMRRVRTGQGAPVRVWS